MAWFKARKRNIVRVVKHDPTEPKALDPSQIYTLLDARARDYRTVLLGIMAGCFGLFVATVNSASTCLDGSKFEKYSQCFTANVPLIYLGMIGLLFLVAAFVIGPEVWRVRLRAEYIRKKYILNDEDVPIVDGLLPRKTRIDDDGQPQPARPSGD